MIFFSSLVQRSNITRSAGTSIVEKAVPFGTAFSFKQAQKRGSHVFDRWKRTLEKRRRCCAPDDVSPLALRNDAARFACNDTTFAPYVPQAYIIREATPLAKSTSFARQCKHHWRSTPKRAFSCIKAHKHTISRLEHTN